MPSKIAMTNLDAKSIDIINVIRQNAPAEYQNLVPEITTEKDIPVVGQVLLGYPALANQFLSALINRITSVKVKSVLFNNPYVDLKKGFLELGETVEEVFVAMAKAREFNVEKAEAREFKRTIPDVRSAFHVMNWRVQYPVTIQRADLERAFLSASGVTDMIARIVDSLYTGANYDEFLLFKYLLIKAISNGKTYTEEVDISDTKNFGIKARAVSNQLTFPKSKYNVAHVTTVTDKADQYIFIDADFEAQYSVEVLASAFNMEKADYIGRRKLIDNWTDFDNSRFDEIRANSTQVEEVTDAELALMTKVKAVIVDGEWFQIYDNLSEFSEKFVASGLYWNYFYNVWKTVSFSPFSNIITIADSTADTDLPETFTFTVQTVSENDNAVVITLEEEGEPTLAPSSYNFTQTADATEKLIAVHKYGAFIVTKDADGDAVSTTPEFVLNGVTYVAGSTIGTASAVGDELTFTQSS